MLVHLHRVPCLSRRSSLRCISVIERNSIRTSALLFDQLFVVQDPYCFELKFCNFTRKSVKVGKMDRIPSSFRLAQMDGGASAHARNRRVSPGRAGRRGRVRRIFRQRMPAATLRRVSHWLDGRRAQDRARHQQRVRRRPPTNPASTGSSPMPSGTPEPSTSDDWTELQEDPSTRYSDQGVIPIDNTLIDRDGMLIPDAGLVLGPRRRTEQDRPGLPLRQLRLHQRQALSPGVPPLPQAGAVRGPERAVPQPHRTVLRVDRLGLRAGDSRRLRDGQLLHQRRDPQPHPRQEGPVGTASGLRRRSEDQPQGGVEGAGSSRPTTWQPRSRQATARRCGSATSGSGTSRSRCRSPT